MRSKTKTEPRTSMSSVYQDSVGTPTAEDRATVLTKDVSFLLHVDFLPKSSIVMVPWTPIISWTFFQFNVNGIPIQFISIEHYQHWCISMSHTQRWRQHLEPQTSNIRISQWRNSNGSASSSLYLVTTIEIFHHRQGKNIIYHNNGMAYTCSSFPVVMVQFRLRQYKYQLQHSGLSMPGLRRKGRNERWLDRRNIDDEQMKIFPKKPLITTELVAITIFQEATIITGAMSIQTIATYSSSRPIRSNRSSFPERPAETKQEIKHMAGAYVLSGILAAVGALLSPTDWAKKQRKNPESKGVSDSEKEEHNDI